MFGNTIMENQTDVFDIAIWLSIAILVTAIGLWLNIKYRHLNPKMRETQSAIDWIRVNDAANLDQLSQMMDNKTTLAFGWKQFRETLFTEANKIIATQKAAVFFNEVLIDSGKFDIRFASAIPGYLLSTGLLFTFVGLLLALNSAVELSQSGDIAASSLALQGLLSAAAFKFLTSITGLGCSILFSISLRKNLHKSRNLLDTLCYEIDSRLRFETTETLSLRQMSEAKFLNQQLIDSNQAIVEKQTNAISQLMGSIGVLQNSIGENNQSLNQHANTVGKGISHLISETKSINSQLVTDMRSANEDGLHAIVSAFVEKFNAETQARFREINKQLTLAQENFSHISSGLLKSGTQFQNDIHNAGNEIKTKITEASNTLNKSFGESARNMMKTTNNMENILSSLHLIMGNLHEGTEAILEANKNIGPVSERFEATTRDFVAVVPEISGLMKHFKKFYSIFHDFNSNMRSIDNVKVTELSQLVEFSRKSTDLVEEYQQSSIAVNKELRKSIDAFHNMVLMLDQDIKLISDSKVVEKKWNQVN